MRSGVDEAALARALGRGPARVEPVGRSDGKQADIAAVLRHQPDRLDRLRYDRAGISDDHLAIPTRRALPIRALDDRLPPLPRHRALYLPPRPPPKAQIDR